MKSILIILLLHTLLGAASTMRPATYEGIQEANKLIDTKQYDKAFALFDELISETSKKRVYDHAFLQNAYGYLWIQKEDYGKAITSYQKALSYKVLPKQMQTSITLTLAQLFLQQSAFHKTIALIEKWHKEKKPTALSAKLLMISFISLEDKVKGLFWCQKAVALSSKPSLPLYQTKLSLELQLVKYPDAIKSLTYMLKHFKPKLIYFKQLAFLYAQQNQEAKGVALLESAYQMDLLEKKDDLLQLAQLLHQEGAAIKAEVIIEKLQLLHPEDEKISNYLSMLQIESKEYTKALKTLHTLYEQTKKTKVALKLAQLYAQKEQWKETVFYTSKIDNNPKAYLLKAIALAQQNKTLQAIKLFRKAEKSLSTRSQARMWLQHLNTQ